MKTRGIYSQWGTININKRVKLRVSYGSPTSSPLLYGGVVPSIKLFSAFLFPICKGRTEPSPTESTNKISKIVKKKTKKQGSIYMYGRAAD